MSWKSAWKIGAFWALGAVAAFGVAFAAVVLGPPPHPSKLVGAAAICGLGAPIAAGLWHRSLKAPFAALIVVASLFAAAVAAGAAASLFLRPMPG